MISPIASPLTCDGYRCDVTEASDDRSTVRERIVEVAARLLAEQGRSAVTTRGVAESAGVQAPTIYRLFGDKDGLLDAVAEHVMAQFAATKAAAVAAGQADDPVTDLRHGWELTIDFGLTNPELFVLLTDPVRARQSPAAQAGIRLLAERVHRVALAGRLGVSEADAVQLIHAAGTGAILAILAGTAGPAGRTVADQLLEAVLTRILTPQGPEPAAASTDVAAHAIALRAHAGQLRTLSSAERRLLTEWLDRVVDGG